MVQTPTKTLTLAEFLTLPETDPASEYIDGKIIQKPMPKGSHSTIQGEGVAVINAMTKPQRIAWAFPELRCTFGGRSIVPDIAMFTWERIPIQDDGNIAENFNVFPDWSIEILSPEQSVTRVTLNLLHCLKYGCQLGWLIDPAERLVIVYSPNQSPSYFEEPRAILPVPEFASGVQLTLEQLFGWLKVR
jgi:Uma2 family endonuclease